MNSEIYWIYLQRTLGIGSRKVASVIDCFGSAEQFYRADMGEKKGCGLLSKSELERAADMSLKIETGVVEQCDKMGFTVITPESDAYPERLENLINPPAVLYVDGQLPDVDNEVMISIVGTRHASSFGMDITSQLAARLTRAGAIIVSGGAAGIDTASHIGALNAGGRTVAVLGCGLNYPYLMSNAGLREEISHSGALVSEFPPNVPPSRFTFPVRNRIISGLSLGTVVVEAGKKSGSLITVNHALEQGRDVFAIPGSLSDRQSEGSNRMIVDGAKPVLCPRDILFEYAAMYPHKLDLRGSEQPLEAVPIDAGDELIELEPVSDSQVISGEILQSLTADAADVYAAIDSDADLSAVVEATGIDSGRALAALTELEISGLITAIAGGRYKRI
ncbi:MAG: DNA-processing protein DprA [Firmicutes bacterium]|nr:DNA-processing protein DprA [Bacillota bacterium]